MTNIRQVDAYEQAVRASGKALEAKQEGFKAGANSNLDVLDAQRDLFLARRDLLQSRYRYILNLLKLENLVGRTDATVIERINSWLER
jgi:outer membrane protein